MIQVRSPVAAASPTVGPAIVLMTALVTFPVVSRAADEVPAALRFFNNALFLAVIAVLGIAIWWLRRRLQPGSARGSGARVLPVAMLGTRERIAVVEFEGRRLLVGVTSQQITLLCELDRAGFSGSLGLANTQSSTNLQGGELQAGAQSAIGSLAGGSQGLRPSESVSRSPGSGSSPQ